MSDHHFESEINLDILPHILENLESTFETSLDLARRYHDPGIWADGTLLKQINARSARGSASKLNSILIHIDKPYRLQTIRAWYRRGLIDNFALRDLLARWYAYGVEFTAQTKGLRSLFRAAGFVSDDPSIEVPTKSVEIYRGAIKRKARSYSWTTDIEKARWFAIRFALEGEEARRKGLLPGFIFQATIPPSGILAIFVGRGESEIVVDPTELVAIRVIEGPLTRRAV